MKEVTKLEYVFTILSALAAFILMYIAITEDDGNEAIAWLCAGALTLVRLIKFDEE